MLLTFLCEKSGAIALVLLGLTAGRQAAEILLNLEIFKIKYQMKYSTFLVFDKGTVLL